MCPNVSKHILPACIYIDIQQISIKFEIGVGRSGDGHQSVWARAGWLTDLYDPHAWTDGVAGIGASGGVPLVNESIKVDGHYVQSSVLCQIHIFPPA